MKLLFSILSTFFLISSCAQDAQRKFNLDFEQNTKNLSLPDSWFKWGTYELQKDSVTVHSGKYSGFINSGQDSSSFGRIAYKIPANYKGDSITLEGFMKIENVRNGFAGLLLRIDGSSGVLAFDNMQDRKINGSKDWEKYTITLPFIDEAEFINVAGILEGNGKAWFDDFVVKIDGKDIQTLKEIEKPVAKAPSDNEFDESSKFYLDKITPLQINNLYKLCKIWGFVKYYHPEIAKGNINWDSELFRILPKTNSKQFDKEILKWLKPLKIEDKIQTKANEDTSNCKIKPATHWITDESFLNKNISNELVNIKNSKKEASNYYISFVPDVGNPIFKNERPYLKMKWDDTGFRLLALFRFWNMIEYFFPNKHLMDRKWDDVLKEYIPRIVMCNDELSYKLCILSLIGEIQDTHANIYQDNALNVYFGTKTAPVEIQFVENKAVVVRTFPQLKLTSRIKVGDIITKVNGKDVDSLIKEKIKYCPASNYPTQLRNVTERLLRTDDDSIFLSLQNNTGSYSEMVNTIAAKGFLNLNKHIESNKEIGKDIGYIYPASIKDGEIDEIMKKFLNKKGIIIDMRCYPSDFIVFSLGKYLMPEPVGFVKFTRGSLKQPGLFKYTDTLKVGEHNPDYFKGKVIILINENTQSQAEYTTMALRKAPKAKVIGSTTAGADGNVSSIILPGSIKIMISGIGVYYPDGIETQRVGIIPDIEIKPTIEGIRAGKDELLEKAIELINE